MEQSFIAWAKVRAHRLKQIKLGIGDDAALLKGKLDSSGQAEDLVVTTDSLMEGVHFLCRETSYKEVGRKLALVNMSDLAAMAADPTAFFLSLCLPKQSESPSDLVASQVYEGVCEIAEQYGFAVAGGDTNCWDGPLVLHGTAIGQTVESESWLRSGAQPEDLILVTGPLGGSILGKHLDFLPRFDVVQKLRGKGLVHAAMDISDGLCIDLLRICDASHCGAILDLEQVPTSSAAEQVAQRSGKSASEHALSDGEDFELLLAVAPSDLNQVEQLIGREHCFCCGTFTSRTGLWQRAGGKILQMTAAGYVHS